MNIRRNMAWNIAEVIASTIMIFVLYKVIVARLGVESLGVWALVLAATSIGRFVDVGMTGGLSRYVAGVGAGSAGPGEVRAYIDTAVLMNAALYGALALALYWPAWWALGLTLSGAVLAEARSLLPYAIAAFALQNIAAVIVAALTGFHRSYEKSMVMMGTLVVQAIVALSLIGPMGLKGVAIGQIVQYLLLMLAGWLLVMRQAEGRWALTVPHRFRKPALLDLIGFGVRLQALNIATFLFDPIVKFTFSAIGGVAALGLYELVQRGLLQLRQILLAPTQNLTPLFAAASHRNRADLGRTYQQAVALMIAAAVPAMGAMAIGSPILSLIWLGRVDNTFVLYSFIAATGWLVNILGAPAWHLGVGTGHLRWNIAGALLSSAGGLVLGYGLGRLFGPTGVLVGAMIAIGVGGLLTWVMNVRSLGLPMLPSTPVWRQLSGQAIESGRRLLRVRAS